MATFAFVQQKDGAEVARLCATDASRPLKLSSGDTKAPAEIVVGDVVLNGPHGFFRVDQIITS